MGSKIASSRCEAALSVTLGGSCDSGLNVVVVHTHIVMGSVAAKFYICRNRYFQLPPKYTYIGIGSLNEDTTSSATCRQVVELGRLW